MTTPESPFLDTKQAAAYCNLSVTSFREHVACRVRRRRVGRKPLYAKEDLDEVMSTVFIEEVTRERRESSRRRGSAHAKTAQDPRAKELAEQLERRLQDGG